ncbi:MAG: dienelactone hydrolase family protein [Kofleriaceae bacterium]
MHSESISYDHGGTTYVGYLAAPDASSAARPAVLICHEGNGLGPQVKERANTLAELGYIVFALDYVGGGEVLPDMAAMQAKLGSLRGDPDKVRGLAAAGLAVLVKRPGVSRVAATGYCFGGTMALELARSGADLVATVVFHAGLRALGETAKISGKVLACTGADDPLVPPEDRVAFEQEMRAAGVDWRHEVYGNAVHGFANPKADALGVAAVRYNERAHRRSWQAMLALFDEAFELRAGHRPAWPTIIPRIFTPEPAEVVRFAHEVFGATGELPEHAPAQLRIGDSVIMASDGGGVRPPQTATLYIHVADVDAAYARALAAGATSLEAPKLQPWGDRVALVRDRTGNVWQIGTSA